MLVSGENVQLRSRSRGFFLEGAESNRGKK
jgi:hypothetical protein